MTTSHRIGLLGSTSWYPGLFMSNGASRRTPCRSKGVVLFELKVSLLDGMRVLHSRGHRWSVVRHTVGPLDCCSRCSRPGTGTLCRTTCGASLGRVGCGTMFDTLRCVPARSKRPAARARFVADVAVQANSNGKVWRRRSPGARSVATAARSHGPARNASRCSAIAPQRALKSHLRTRRESNPHGHRQRGRSRRCALAWHRVSAERTRETHEKSCEHHSGRYSRVDRRS